VSGSRGDPFLGAGHGVAKPAFAPDLEAAFVEKSIIDDELDDSGKRKGGEDEKSQAVKQFRRTPGRAFKKVVRGVLAMRARELVEFAGRRREKDAEKGVSSKAHDPAKQNGTVGRERRCRENGTELLDER